MACPILALLVAPAAWMAYQWRAMPQLGFYHDDSLYWVSAKSLADGGGYRVESLPGQPYQTKYPPLFPALLALAWKVNPSFPSNLPVATLLVWLFFPAFVGLLWKLFETFGFGFGERVALTALAALNPMAVLLSFTMMPELLFVSLLTAAILVSQKDGLGWLAGLLAGAAYLAKSAALPMLLAVPLAYLLRKRRGDAAWFAGAMLPAIAGWQAWVQSHLAKSHDVVSLYYLDYVGFFRDNINWKNLPVVVWYNVDSFLMSVGKLLTFDTALLDSRHLERLVAVGALAGALRLTRRCGRFEYPLTALGFTAMLLVWHYQPDQRFVFPLYPLLLAGLWTELKNLAGMLRASWAKPKTGDRVAAVAMGSAVGLFGLFVAAGTLYGLFGFLPLLMSAYRADLQARLPAYEWIAKSAPAAANVYAYDDPMLFLYTGRQSCSMPVPTKYYYPADKEGIDRLVDSLPRFAREHRLDYLFLTSGDYYRDLHEERVERLRKAVRADAGLSPSFQSPAVSIYAVR